MAKINLTNDELKEQLEEQLGHLKSSSELFDNGDIKESKRLAVTLRNLFHDGGSKSSSRSLLGQLGMLDHNFISSASRFKPTLGTNTTYLGIILVNAKENDAQFYAPLDDAMDINWLPFGDWWNEIIFIDTLQTSFTRKSLIKIIADQDGGAHVDLALEESYYKLSRENSIGYTINKNGNMSNFNNPELFTIRQITHEVFKTIDSNYYKKPAQVEITFGNLVIHTEDFPPNKIIKKVKIGRNDPCPCGLGKKYKFCHGKAI